MGHGPDAIGPELLQQDRNNFWMVVLESTIILLFVIDLLLLVWMR